MQAKIIDFASDKLVNALQKIDKKDVHKMMTNFSGKSKKTDQQTSSNLDGVTTMTNRVTSSEEYCAMLQKEFVLMPIDKKDDKNALNTPQKDTPRRDYFDSPSKSVDGKSQFFVRLLDRQWLKLFLGICFTKIKFR